MIARPPGHQNAPTAAHRLSKGCRVARLQLPECESLGGTSAKAPGAALENHLLRLRSRRPMGCRAATATTPRAIYRPLPGTREPPPVPTRDLHYSARGQIETLSPRRPETPGPDRLQRPQRKRTERGRRARVACKSCPARIAGRKQSTHQTTIAYNVPVRGSAPPRPWEPPALAAWGQSTIPIDATAIFPPDQVQPIPSSYTRATVYYMDAEG